jgi:GNAT superfamily N-acetyltransferase
MTMTGITAPEDAAPEDAARENTAPAGLRPATPADAAACAAILNEWVAETPWFPDLHGRGAALPFVLGKIATETVTVALAGDGRVAGFLARDGAWVSCLYVAAAHRGRGLGAALLGQARDAAPQGLRLWTFQANMGAQRFYRREGMIESALTDGDNMEGLPDIEFTWSPA